MIKKLDKTSWIIIGVTATLMALAIGYSFYLMKKAEKEAKSTEPTQSYATNATTSATSATSATSSETDDTSPSTTTSWADADHNWFVDEDGEYGEDFDDDINPGVPPDEQRGDVDDEEPDLPVTFKSKDDANANSSYIDLDTISIDGILVDFPSSYSIITQKFGSLKTIYDTPADPETIIDDEIMLIYTGKTGEGEVYFTFSCEGEAKALKDCVCKDVLISSYKTDADKYNMTMAIKGNVKFGDNYETVTKNFPYTVVDHDTTDGSFFISYNINGTQIFMTGENGGLVQILFMYS